MWDALSEGDFLILAFKPQPLKMVSASKSSSVITKNSTFFLHLKTPPLTLKNLNPSLRETTPLEGKLGLPDLAFPAKEEPNRPPPALAFGSHVPWFVGQPVLFRSLGRGTRDPSRFTAAQSWGRRLISKVKSKQTGGPVHLGDSGYEDGEEGCPGGQAEEMGEEGPLGVLPGRVSAPPMRR